ncbi:myosin II heavy chain Myo3 [Schizosaccharomyces pombe]|uniref:Myosin type-2 heavy chain 2 n=1 Tax=Schizosaccharomyces pombe (strain 972 / ATCC 24843) TaxID=284812 RepID=MYO3_SCHPO|nr:Myo3-like myosin II heavy chain myp2 [Schizosaccharomyces pombe]O14157.1 RecName: Full=Myosin type-2 heavy chain 2; AltName: Full=Myosin type II heavy chain 2 [Schizosaccharomyces pombe 972h-]BAA24579.1 Myo3 [Schizosaccharomyces pombe]CAB11475.1 myosin II heavy chain Myo3 [Schizosaccharomyces pombe]|eukprot:NP_593816.1 Myo3-like myosin II heavy chain myp2 [Schizosaccharomyces pombe]
MSYLSKNGSNDNNNIIKKLVDAEKHCNAVKDASFDERTWIWIPDSKESFVKAWIVEDLGEKYRVKLERDGSERIVDGFDAEKVNPPKFDMVDDMAALTCLNEPSVVNNLTQRYEKDLIYTYSGLFLVAVNPYCHLPIYGDDVVRKYQSKQFKETKPHIFGTADAAYRSLLERRINQSILVTGESGAGKTETTKKVIQYLTSVTDASTSDSQQLEKKILETNPVLEAFGNAQTVRNNNSSRFGKFIRIEFSNNGSIVGANLDWYLLEKSRVIHPSSNERNYHVFYQLLRGADGSLLESLFLDRYVDHYSYLKNGLKHINGVDDGKEFQKLCFGLRTLGFDNNEIHSLFLIIASILHIGNIEVASDRSGQARFPSLTQIDQLCHLLEIPVDGFVNAALHPKSKAGREWIVTARTREQVVHTLQSLAKGLYERNFAHLVKRLNQTMYYSQSEHDGFIGVLDIAGFEIFTFNSFEQLCINFTNEKLQQFFNHYMFVLEQEEYTQERIEWDFIDYGNDLQPTIDAIEKSEPIGIFSCLDEDCVMPMATDATFTEKLHLLFKGKSDIYRPKKFSSEGFVLKHYAGDVEYDTKDWLEKNKDPLNACLAALMFKSTNSHVSSLFDDYSSNASGRDNIEKKGIFRTVSQRHRRQLSSLMHQLEATQPHFVRCIIPNNLKQPHNLDKSLVLHQLRCNGVLEGIRIAQTGFPNKLFYTEFRARYGILSQSLKRGYVEAKKATITIINELKLPSTVYRLGETKVFFKASVLGSLEDRRNALLRVIFNSFSARIRGFLTRRRLYRFNHRQDAAILLQHNLRQLKLLKPHPWWNLFLHLKPLLGTTQTDEYLRRKDALINNLQNQLESTKEVANELTITKERVLQLTNDLQEEQALAHEKDILVERANSRVEVVHERLSSLENQVTIADEKYEFLYAEKQSIEEDLANKQTEISYLSDLSSTLEKKLSSIKKDEQTISSKYKELEKDYLNIMADYQHSSQHLSNLEKAINEKNLNIRELNEKLMRLDDELLLKQRSYDTKVQELREENASLKDQCRTYESQLASLVSKYSETESELNKKEAELVIFQKEITEYRDQLHKAFQNPEKTHNINDVKSGPLNSDENIYSTSSTTLSILKDVQELKSLHTKEANQLSERIKEISEMLEQSIATEEKLRRKNSELCDIIEALKYQIQDQETEIISLNADNLDLKDTNGVLEKNASDFIDFQGIKSRYEHKISDLLNQLQKERCKVGLLKQKTENRSVTQHTLDGNSPHPSFEEKHSGDPLKRIDGNNDDRKIDNKLLKTISKSLDALQLTVEEELSNLYSLSKDLSFTDISGHIPNSIRKLEKGLSTLSELKERLNASNSDRPSPDIFKDTQAIMNSRKLLSNPNSDAQSGLISSLQKKLYNPESNMEFTGLKPLSPSKISNLPSSQPGSPSKRSGKMEALIRNFDQNSSIPDPFIVNQRNSVLQTEFEKINLKLKEATKSGILDNKDLSKFSELIQSLLKENEELKNLTTSNLGSDDKMLDFAPLLEDVPNNTRNQIKGFVEKAISSKRAIAKLYSASEEKLFSTEKALREITKERDRLLHGLQGPSVPTSPLKAPTASQLIIPNFDGSITNYSGEEETEWLQEEVNIMKIKELTSTVNKYREQLAMVQSLNEHAESSLSKAERSKNYLTGRLQEVEELARGFQTTNADLQNELADAVVKQKEYEVLYVEKSNDYNTLLLQKEKLMKQIDEFHVIRVQDLEEREKKDQLLFQRYQKELNGFKVQLEEEREKNLRIRQDNRHMHAEIGDIRTKFDELVLEKTNLLKENSILQADLQSLSRVNNSSSTAQQNAQSQLLSLTAQLQEVREANQTLRKDQDTLLRENRNLERKLHEVSEQLNKKFDSSARPFDEIEMEKEVLTLKSNLAQKDDLLSSLVERIKQIEMFALKTQKDSNNHREENLQLHRQLGVLQKEKKDLELKLFDLDLKTYPISTSKDVRMLQKQISDLEASFAASDIERIKGIDECRNRDRTIRQLEAQISKFDDDKKRIQSSVSRLEERNAQLRNQLEDVQASETQWKFALRRTEHALQEERERVKSLETDFDKYRSLLEGQRVKRSESRLSMRSNRSPSVLR